MAGYYYSPDAYHHSGGDFISKPIPNVHTSLVPLDHDPRCDPYKAAPGHANNDHHLNLMRTTDQRLKYRIRVLRLVSRILALGLSFATLVPLVMTLVKFFQTKNDYFTVNGKTRTAWPQDPITWYTWMYFGVSLVSFVFNFFTIVAYWRGTDKANKVSSIASWWTTAVLVFHVIVWAIGTAVYR